MTATSSELDTPASPAWVRRYLALLGVDHDPPSHEALARLMRAQIGAVPFENITALLRRHDCPSGPAPAPDPDQLLANWEAGSGGGVCFEIAPMFGRLLRGFGYRVTLVIAQISFPGGHQALLVDLDEGRFLVDVGCGAPLFAPIPVAGETEVRYAGLAYRFHAGETEAEWVQDRWIEGEWRPFCRYSLLPADAETRETAYQRHNTPGESWVVGPPRIVRCRDDEVFSLAGDELTRFTAAGKTTERIADPAAYERLATEIFRIPSLPIAAG